MPGALVPCLMRIVFLGTPHFAVPTLERLAREHDVVAVYTQPPRPAGRGKGLRPSPVQQRAQALGVAVRSPVTLRDESERQALRELAPEAVVVAAYGLILPPAVLAIPPRGCLNVHASLLPRWRGAAPIQRAILAGDEETGVTIMQMERGLDTGPMLAVRRVALADKDAGALTAELAQVGADAMAQVLAARDAYPPVPQPEEGVTYAAKVEKGEARLNFSQTADTVARQVRAFAPVPGAFFEHGGERVRVLAAQAVDGKGPPGNVMDGALTIACEEGAIRPSLVQRAGRGAMMPAELLRGFSLPAGTRLA